MEQKRKDFNLYSAVINNKLEDIKNRIKEGANINSKQINNQSLLHYAIFKGNMDIIKYLVSNGIDINAVDEGINTPLHIASQGNNLEIVKYLVENGANFSKNKNIQTPIDVATNKDIIKFLKSKLKTEAEVIKSLGIDEINNTQIIPQIFKEDLKKCYIADTGKLDNVKKCRLDLWTELVKSAGTGRFAEVKLGKSRKEMCSELYAIKIVILHEEGDYLKIISEYNLFKYFNSLNNPYFPKVHEYFRCDTKQGVLVMESFYITLSDYIKDNNPDWEWWLIILKQLIEALSNLEEIGISQNDLHLNNIMLKTKDKINIEPHIGLIDFNRMISYKKQSNYLTNNLSNISYDGSDLYEFCYSIIAQKSIKFPPKLLEFCKEIKNYYNITKKWIPATKLKASKK
jgi:hypothetical protein